jgi:hypothetical protein
VILVDLDDLTADPAGDLPELALLIGGRLIDGRNPKIENSGVSWNAAWLMNQKHTMQAMKVGLIFIGVG